jgi:hypothetical protein
MSHLRKDERKEGSSLFDKNRQAELQIITWSIGVILASIIIDPVAAVLKDFVNSSPTVLWNDLNCFSIALRFRAERAAESYIAHPNVKLGSTAVV